MNTSEIVIVSKLMYKRKKTLQDILLLENDQRQGGES